VPDGAGPGQSHGSTVLFVHGAHLGGWCWLLVMDRLARDGIYSQAVELPFTSYAGDLACVREAIESARTRGPVHVVGHSYAGTLLAAAGHRASHLTFVAARMPLPREDLVATTPAWRFARYRSCVREEQNGTTQLLPAGRDTLFHRTPRALADFAMARIRPMASDVPADPLLEPAWRAVPASYVVCGDDRAVRPQAQRERAALVSARVELDTDHSPFFSDPAALAEFVVMQHRAMVAA
jgi:pimeloyl-ACP methyl ester carboxylesterase